MKKNILFLTLTLLITTGCSKTWSGVQQDTRDVLDNTKEVIHEATAPEQMVEDVPQVKPLPNLDSIDTIKNEAVKVPSVQVKKPVAVEPVI